MLRRLDTPAFRATAITVLGVLLLVAVICSALYETSGGRSIDDPSNYPTRPLVNLNTATMEDLMQLDGMTETTAERILNHRKLIGRFASAEELADVVGVSDESFARWKMQLTV